MKVTKFAVAVLSLSSFVASAARAQSSSASALVPAEVRQQPFPYPCPTFPHPTPDLTRLPSSDCGRHGPFPGPARPSQMPPVTAEPYNTAVGRRIALISETVGRGDAASLDGMFSGSFSRGGAVDATPVLAAASAGAVPSFAALAPRRAVLIGREVAVSDPVERYQGARIVRVQAKQVVQGAAIAWATAKALDEAAKQANQAVNNYVNRDQTKESIDKYGGCRMKGTCPK